MSTIQSGPAAGWYQDPTMSGTQRYWTGTGWSGHIAPVPQPQAVVRTVDASDERELIAAGFIFAGLLPLVGFILGIVLLAKSKPGPGIGVLFVAFIACFFWTAVLIGLA